MTVKKNHITCFEHEHLRLGDKLTKGQLEALQRFYGEKGTDYYTLTHKGVKFKSFVGVLQLGKTTIEVLPKADKGSSNSKEVQTKWRDQLIKMLKSVGSFKVHAPSSSSLRLKANSILDLYFELFVKELEYLLQRGLVKQYRKTQGNSTALKGRLVFAKHLQHNLIHQERFYVEHTTYDQSHLIHQVLYKALLLLKGLNTSSQLNSRISTLLLSFPEQANIKISENTFARMPKGRKVEPYTAGLQIAQLLLLNYHPNLQQGGQDVLALMFGSGRLLSIMRCARDSLSRAILSKPKTTNLFGRAQTINTSRI